MSSIIKAMNDTSKGIDKVLKSDEDAEKCTLIPEWEPPPQPKNGWVDYVRQHDFYRDGGLIFRMQTHKTYITKTDKVKKWKAILYPELECMKISETLEDFANAGTWDTLSLEDAKGIAECLVDLRNEAELERHAEPFKAIKEYLKSEYRIDEVYCKPHLGRLTFVIQMKSQEHSELIHADEVLNGGYEGFPVHLLPPKRPKPLSPEAQALRRPLKPEELMGCEEESEIKREIKVRVPKIGRLKKETKNDN